MSYPNPDIEASSGARGDLVVANAPVRSSLVNQGLGIPPPRPSLSSETDSPNTPSPRAKVQDTPFDLVSLKDMIANQDNKVKIRPILLVLSGLANCGKSDAIQHLLRHYVEESPYMPMSRKGYVPTTTAHGITFYELLAFGAHLLQLTEVTNEFSFAFGIMSAFKKTMINDKIVPHFPVERSTRQNKSIFEDADLENHLEYVFQHIARFEHIPKSTELTKEEERFVSHLKKLPNGTAVMNIWDTTITSTTALHFLNTLSGHLYNSNTWLFLDIERDLDKLDQPPDDLTSSESNGSHAIKWRPRLHYLLRASKLSHGGTQDADRKRKATIFAKHRKGYNGNLSKKVKELEDKVKQAARQIGVSELIETKVQSINLSDSEGIDDYSQRLYQKLYQIICETPYEEIPLSWIFLRSLFYHQRQKMISKSDLESKAKACGIEGEFFDKFCRFFTSFGSIIDFTLINPEQKLIALFPIDFLRYLDKILHQKDNTLYNNYPMAKKGIVTETICQQVFEVSCSDYMSALVSINLATKVTGLCVPEPAPSEAYTDTVYYIPQMRLSDNVVSHVVPDASSVYLITSIDSPPISKHAKFVKHILSTHTSANFRLVPCLEKNKSILVDLETDTHVTFTSFSSVTRLEISSTNDEVYTSVVRACHELTKPQETGNVKYQFVLLCACDTSVITPSSIPSCYSHSLPNENLSCETCYEAGRIDNEKLKAWNEALIEDPIHKDCQIKRSMELSQLTFIAEEFESHPQFIPSLIEALGYDKDDPKFEGLEGGKLVMEILLDWDRCYTRQVSEENRRKEVARSLLRLGEIPSSLEPTTEDKERYDFFLKIAKEFDIYATYTN